MTTVGVIGAGRVGASCARAIVRDGLVTRLTIYDRTEGYAQGEALDLSHALPMLEPCEIRGRPLTAVEPEDVLVMAFGGHTASVQTRLDLARANLAIARRSLGMSRWVDFLASVSWRRVRSMSSPSTSRGAGRDAGSM